MTDFPFKEVCKAAEQLAKAGCAVHQKWTCEKCGERVTANTANYFTTFGHHEECGHITNIEKKGCNYIVYGDMRKPGVAEAIWKHTRLSPN